MPDVNLYRSRTVKVPKRSGFDKSFQNLFTAKVGTIVPILSDEVIPNTSVNLRLALNAKLPPLASDTFMRCDMKYAAFFVPSRILFPAGFYERWITGSDSYNCLPVCTIPTTCTEAQRLSTLGPGTLADFLGVKMTTQAVKDLGTNVEALSFSALKFLAYHRIYRDWFMNSKVQRDPYMPPEVWRNLTSTQKSYYNASMSLWTSPLNVNGSGYKFSADQVTSGVQASPIFLDGVSLFDLRQANFGLDYFTASTPHAQDGSAARVTIGAAGIDAPAVSGTFSISQLRSANSLQMFLERNNLAQNRLQDYVKSQYGANLSEGVAQRSVLLGSGQFNVYNKGIFMTNNNGTDTNNNPFGSSVGAQYGNAQVSGNDLVIDNFTAQEPGYIFCVVWLSPKVTYSTGFDPSLLRYVSGTPGDVTDMANPLLQNVGNEPVLESLLDDYHMTDAARKSDIFGYADRYFGWKDKADEVHGLLRDGESLQSFALQRTFVDGSNPTIATEFIQIPTDYLDQVAAVTGDIANYGYWCDTYLDYKVSMPLARYSIPSLQDPAEEHGDPVTIGVGSQLQ